MINNPDANLRPDDVWVVDEVTDSTVVALHRHVNERVEVPLSALAPDFHRFSHQPLLDLSELQEYAVLHDEFENSKRYWELSEENGPPESWPDLAEKRLSHLGFMRRVDLTASGLRHLSFYSGAPRAYHGMMFCLPGLAKDDARRLSIWFDSSLNLLQMLVSRIPSRGGWTEYHRNTVAQFYVPDPRVFDEGDIDILDEAFDEVHEVEFPSITEQLVLNTPPDALSDEAYKELQAVFPDLLDKLGEGFSPRRTMDRAILQVLDVEESRYERILALLYPELLKEIVALKSMMD